MATNFEKSIYSAGVGFKALGDALPTLMSLLFKLGLLAMFFAYLIAFTREVWNVGGTLVGVVMVIVGLIALVPMGWAFVSAIRKDIEARKNGGQQDLPPLPPGSLWPFAAVAFLPFAVIIVVHYGFGYGFTSCLLKVTQERLALLPGS